MNNFKTNFAAVLEGESNADLANNAYTMCDAHLKANIANLESKVVTAEMDVTNAKKDLDLAKVNNGALPTDGSSYINNIKRRHSLLQDAKETLENLEEEIKFLTKIKEDNSGEVSEE